MVAQAAADAARLRVDLLDRGRLRRLCGGADWSAAAGSIAAFAAGLTIALIDEELCDCFLEYGETTAEMAMLLTFVFLGGGVDRFGGRFAERRHRALRGLRRSSSRVRFRSWSRSARTRASRAGRLMIAWFGPRGLNSLLLVVIAIAAGIPEAEQVFGIVSVVVVISIVVHGASGDAGDELVRPQACGEPICRRRVAADAGTLLDVGRRSSERRSGAADLCRPIGADAATPTNRSRCSTCVGKLPTTRAGGGFRGRSGFRSMTCSTGSRRYRAIARSCSPAPDWTKRRAPVGRSS